MMQIMRAIADTVNGNLFVASIRYPATESDAADMIMNASRWFNNPAYKNWRIELCNGEIIEDEPVINEIVQTWPIN